MRPRRSSSRRRRRLYWTCALLAVAAVAGATFGVWSYRSSRPSLHRTGEKLEGVTSNLSLGIPEEAPYPRFSEVTSQTGITFRSFSGPRSSQLPEDMGSGAAWGDYDNDGDDDLFLVSAGGALSLPSTELAPSELYENLGDGTFRRVSDFPDTRIIGMGAAWGDYDGDGWLDLVVTGYGSLMLFRNHRGKFHRDERFSAPARYWAGAAWGDFDNDRDLDLYVCGYVRYNEGAGKHSASTRQYGKEVPFTLNPSSFDPERNLLFRNNGDGTFTEVAEQLGVDNPQGRSLNALWHDFNDDGWLDLYIANDISDNALFINRGGTFEDLSHAAWVADYRGAMGLAAGDWDGDGDDDLFVTHWVAQENALYDSLLAELERRKPEVKTSEIATSSTSRPRSSRDTDSPVRFMDVADMKGLGQIALQVVGWGTEFADLDADGWLDLLVANGSTFETSDVPPRLRPQRLFLFWNRRGQSFHDLAPLHGPLAEEHVGRGLAVSDYDGDGDLDFIVIDHSEGARLFRNDMDGGNWLIVRLRSRSSDGALKGRGEGARLVADVNGRRLRRTVGGASYLSQSSRSIHFGLGSAERVYSLEVRWLGGGLDRYTDLKANTIWQLTEGDPTPRRLGPATSAHRAVTGGQVSARAAFSPQEGERDERQRLLAFWQTQRAAVRAMKVEGDMDKAIRLFRKALTLEPTHEDSLYYLGQGLTQKGDLDGALEIFEKLMRVNPASHRGHRQWGFLRALTAKGPDDLSAAESSLERALEINPEETGALLLLAEIDLMQGELDRADQRLAWACRTNPRAAAGFYLRGYLAWKRGDDAAAFEFLRRALQAGERAKKPGGSTAEGDVRAKMHSDATLLSAFFERWDGRSDDLGSAFAALEEHLKAVHGPVEAREKP